MKKTIAILTESIRRDNHLSLRYFKKLKAIHFYLRDPYHDMDISEYADAIRYKNFSDLYHKLLKIKPDIIQGSEPYASKKSLLLAWTAYKAARKLKVPLIFPVLENRPVFERFNRLKGVFLKWFLKKYAEQAKLIFALNDGAIRNLKEIGVPDEKIKKFLWGIWGVDVRLFKPRIEKQESRSKNIILFGGRLDEAKGVRYLMPAFLKVKKETKSAKMIMIGGGELLPWAREFVKKNRLEKDVEFTGTIKTKDLPDYLKKAAVFACPSITLKWWEEQVGMINLQAMACGVPVISTESGAIPEYVPDGKAGILVPEKNPNALAKALVKLLEDKKLRDKMSKFARKYAVSHYDAGKNVREGEEFILDNLK